MQRTAATRRSQIAALKMKIAAVVNAVGKRHRTVLSAISRTGATEETIASNKKFGIARKGRSQICLPELVCAPVASRDYFY